MPIYEYSCSKCNHTEEVLQKMNDAPITRCSHCGKDTLIKMVSAASFQLKGTGWYATDFKDKPKAKAKETASDAPTENSTPATTTTSTKKGDSES